MILKRRKDKELEKLGIDEDEILDFDQFIDFEEQVKQNKEQKIEDIEKDFIFHIENGCPICGSDVKGNDYYKYFCASCNVLFERKDIIDKEFGKSVRTVGVRKTKLSDEEKEELEKKRRELSENVRKVFSEKKVRAPAEEEPEETGEEEKAEGALEPEETLEEEKGEVTEGEAAEEPEEVEAEVIPAYESEDEVLEEQETSSLEDVLGLVRRGPAETGEAEDTETYPEEVEEGEEREESDAEERGVEGTGEEEESVEEETLEGVEEDQAEDEDAVEESGEEEIERWSGGAEGSEEGDEHEEEPDERKPREEYDLDEPDRIVASKESTKMHVGTCHHVRKIHPDNRIYLDSIEQGEEEGYELCVCLRRIVALQRKGEG